MLIEGTSELIVNSSILLTTNNSNDIMYCECNGRIFNLLNNSRHEILLSTFIIILITFFCNLKMQSL